MPYLNLDPDYFDHPKTRRLKSLLDSCADVYPIRLWAYVAKYHCEDADLGDYAEAELAGIMGYAGDPSIIVTAMLRVGFLVKDGAGRTHVKDWAAHEGHIAAYRRRAIVANNSRWGKLAGNNAPSNATSISKESPNQPTNQPYQPTKTDTVKIGGVEQGPAIPADQDKPQKPGSKGNQRPRKSSAAGDNPGFNAFWVSYPKKIAKEAARRIYERISPSEELNAVIISAVQAWSKSPQWTKDGGQFIPHAATWLNQKRWQDEIPKGGNFAAPIKSKYADAWKGGL